MTHTHIFFYLFTCQWILCPFASSSFVFCHWVVRVLYTFWITHHYQIRDLQMFSPFLWVVFSPYWWCPLKDMKYCRGKGFKLKLFKSGPGRSPHGEAEFWKKDLKGGGGTGICCKSKRKQQVQRPWGQFKEQYRGQRIWGIRSYWWLFTGAVEAFIRPLAFTHRQEALEAFQVDTTWLLELINTFLPHLPFKALFNTQTSTTPAHRLSPFSHSTSFLNRPKPGGPLLVLPNVGWKGALQRHCGWKERETERSLNRGFCSPSVLGRPLGLVPLQWAHTLGAQWCRGHWLSPHGHWIIWDSSAQN